jgi:hypothetical protein
MGRTVRKRKGMLFKKVGYFYGNFERKSLFLPKYFGQEFARKREESDCV